MYKKWHNTLQIAIYGKGGIGKSTTSSNISYGMSSRGIKVLQIGCDPKHDSTRSLLKGVTQPTVLEALDIKSSEPQKLEDLVVESSCGVSCVECGGPEPGIGCAGRGIITAMNELKRCGLKKEDYDVVLYDVLGDVVCGGFAVPLRKEYADVVYLVTSGEFMAVYAANNIIRGITNHSGDRPRIGGIILNCRGMEDEDDLVRRFSEAVGVPIICRVPRDPLFAVAEKNGVSVSEMFPDSEPAVQYGKIIENIKGQIDGSSVCYPADPLNDEELDRLLKGKEIVRDPCRNCGKIRIKPSDGEACAARAAAMSLSAIKGLTIVIHGPRACGYNMANIRDVHFLGDVKENPDLDRTFSDSIVCTDMDDNDSIFGGIHKLESMLERLCSSGIDEIAVLTSCIPGIIGDDVGTCIETFRKRYPGTVILDIRADGNLSGTAFDGIRMVRNALVSLVDRDVVPDDGIVNIISNTGLNAGRDRRRLTELFGCMGKRINTILFSDCTLDQVRNCRRASMCYAISRRDLTPANRAIFESCGLKVSDILVPQGVKDTVSWLERFKEPSNASDIDRYVEEKTDEYRKMVERSKPVLEGKRIFLAGWLDRPMDWVADALKDAGAVIVGAVSMGPIPGRPFHTDRHTDVPVVEKTDSTSVLGFIGEHRPDLVLGGIRGGGMCLGFKNGAMPSSSVSIDASTDLLEYVSNLIRAPVCSSWMSERGSQ
ncbi:MAG: AAA family ATPase [archaeon]|nr:AAA family ATPase [archaeon]